MNYSLGTGKFYLESTITEDEAKKLVNKTIKRLQKIDSASLSKLHLVLIFIDTIKLQIGYDSAYVR